jgi:hypothetical protein
MAASQKNFKIWRATPNSSAGMQVTPESALLIGSKYNFVAATSHGISLMGTSITFGTTSENIRTGGLFIKMNDFVRMIPQTMVTPIPSQIPFPPLGMILSIVKDLPFFMAMMAG